MEQATRHGARDGTAEVIEILATTPFRELAPSAWYPGFLPGLPDLLVLSLPRPLRNRGGSPVNAAHKLLFVENEEERRMVEDALDKPIPVRGNVVDFRNSIDRAHARPSAMRVSRDAGILHYAPPVPGFPWWVVTAMPFNMPGMGLARDRYGYAGFATDQEAQDHIADLAYMCGLNAGPGGNLRVVTPDQGRRH